MPQYGAFINHLNRLVAEHIFEWESLTGEGLLDRAYPPGTPEHEDPEFMGRAHKEEMWYVGSDFKACSECSGLPNWAGELEAAYGVLDWLRRYHEVEIRTGPTADDHTSWRVAVLDAEEVYKEALGYGEDLPEAICKAALTLEGVDLIEGYQCAPVKEE